MSRQGSNCPELAADKLNRALRTLSAATASIIHGATEEQLVDQVARILVEIGGYRLAWIGLVRPGDDALLVQKGLFFEGHHPRDGVRTDVRMDGSGSACEMISRAVRLGRFALVRRGGPDRWSQACRQLTRLPHYGAALALPLRHGAVIFGALALYARDVDAFDEDEIQLLSDLAGHLGHAIAALRDARRRSEAESALAEEQRFLQSVIDGVAEPTLVIGVDHEILLMNQASRVYLAKGAAVAKGARCHEVIYRSAMPCGKNDRVCPLEEVRHTGKTARVVQQHLLADGRSRTFELEASPLWNADGSLRGIVQTARDISERLAVEASLRENQDRLDYLAHHDPLTNLPNRLRFNSRLQQAMARARDDRQQVALLFLDLDRFKNINDSLGHEFGDQVLLEVAGRLRKCLRGGDTVARLGGDEFVVILEGIEDLKGVALVARNILRTLGKAFRVGQHELFVTTSIGISLFPSDAQNLESLMRFADVAMYRAKEEGRNNYQFYRPEMNVRTQEMLVLESNLRRAMAEKQLRVYYQPQFDLRTRRMIGLEALLRWEHPVQGMISPADFIPLAEETGLIVPLGQWVLQSACAQAKEWQQQGYLPVRMAVNISAREFRQPDFVDNLDAILAETGLDPHWLELEITESIAMQNFEETILTLTDLKIRGVHLAIDDFGTGYSSLNYLKRFPISKLKIDQSFVRDINRDSNDEAIATSIIALGRSMNMQVIAEGVESEDQAELLLSKGCHQAQGYLFSAAVPAARIEPYLLRHQPGTGSRAAVIQLPRAQL
ncbi:putative bifunctional diguanylate cyclase/phosphodiesterase [Geoalkalibacter sp.]|uniref:putative bifunctional diguanylate cyclase/phosphodiesterase n=1 Tax=Geoalkalibacter sp. TaxID=3041440 RepID=UPI00272EE722|nr:EAL domain-containing protein [Geoalkalibacter sp.]